MSERIRVWRRLPPKRPAKDWAFWTVIAITAGIVVAALYCWYVYRGMLP